MLLIIGSPTVRLCTLHGERCARDVHHPSTGDRSQTSILGSRSATFCFTCVDWSLNMVDFDLLLSA